MGGDHRGADRGHRPWQEWQYDGSSDVRVLWHASVSLPQCKAAAPLRIGAGQLAVQPLPTWPEVCGRDVRDDGPSVDDAADIDGASDGGVSDYDGA